MEILERDVRDVEKYDIIASWFPENNVASNSARVLPCLYCVPLENCSRRVHRERRNAERKEYGVGNHANILWHIKALNSYSLLVLHLGVVKQLLKESWPMNGCVSTGIYFFVEANL